MRTEFPGTPRRRVERAVSLDVGRPLDTFAARRTCSHPECTVVLSRYNPNPTCATHGGWHEDKTPRRRPRPLS